MRDKAATIESLSQLHEICRDSGLPEDYAVAAFSELLRADLAAADESSGAPARQHQASEHRREGSTSRLRDVDPETLSETFHIEDGDFELLIPAKRLAPSVAEAARQIALLVAAGRQDANLEEWTQSETIRSVCADYRKFDSKNFGTVLGGMDDVFLIRGKGRTREFKVAKPGWQRASDLIRSLQSGGEG